MKRAILYPVVSSLLLSLWPFFGAADAAAASMSASQCVRSVELLEKEMASLNSQIKACKKESGRQQLRVKLNRTMQKLRSTTRLCAGAAETPAATSKSGAAPANAGGLNLAGRSGAIAGLGYSGNPLAASGTPTSAADAANCAKSGKTGASNPKFDKLNCKFWIFGCSSIPDVDYGEVDGELFVDGGGDASNIDASDVNQGGIGDCYYLASVAAISRQDPDRIKNMMRQNDDGTISVDFNKKKHWWEFWKDDFSKKTVTVDNTFPLDKNGNPVFAQFGDQASNGKLETWVMAMEKAYAQFHGDYNDIASGGWPEDAMEQLTGKKSQKFSASSVTLEQFADWDKKGYAITMASKSSVSNKDVVGGHAYYYKGVDLDKKTISLGNPWGYNHATLSLEEFQKNYSYVAINPIK